MQSLSFRLAGRYNTLQSCLTAGFASYTCEANAISPHSSPPKTATPDELKQLEANLWRSADDLRANSGLKSNEYATPVLGLIFLKFADNRYRQYEAEIRQEYEALKGGRREKAIAEIALEKCGFYLPDHARYDYLLNLPEEKDIAKALKEAMQATTSSIPGQTQVNAGLARK